MGFEILERCEVRRPGVTIESVLATMRDSLSRYYRPEDIKLTPSGLVVSGDLKSFFERAITKAEATVEIIDERLSYRVIGETFIGKWPWFWLVLGCCAFVMGFDGSIFVGIFFICLFEYGACSGRPKKYFEEVFKAVKFNLE